MRRLTRDFAILSMAVMLPMLADAVEVRTAPQNSQPKFIKGEDGFSGLCIDIFKAIERVDPSLKFSEMKEYVSLPRIEALLEDGSLDAFCGTAKTEARKARVDFIEVPIYVTHSVLAARADDPADIGSFDDLRKLGDEAIVLAVSRTVQAEKLAAQPGIKFDLGGKDTSANLRKLVEGRGRFVFQNDFALADEIKRDKLVGKVRILPANLDSEGGERYFVVSRKASPEIKAKLRAALEKLARNGELEKLFAPYRPR